MSNSIDDFNIPVEVLDLTPRTINLLRKYGYETVGKLNYIKEIELTELEGVGLGAVRGIPGALSKYRHEKYLKPEQFKIFKRIV